MIEVYYYLPNWNLQYGSGSGEISDYYGGILDC